MKLKNKFLWFAAAYAVFVMLLTLAAAFLLAHLSTPPEKELLKRIITHYAIYIVAAVVFITVGYGLVVEWMFRGYITPIRKLTEEVALIYSANPSHRIQIEGSVEFKRLVEQINTGTDQFEALQKDVSKKIETAMAELAKERNILAAMMAELPEAILICNREGQIILYNTQAKRFFNEQIVRHGREFDTRSGEEQQTDFEEKKFLGIGRSIFDLIDRNVVQHALDEMHGRLERREENVVSSFVLTAKGNRLLRGRTVPVLTSQASFSGFLIIFYDITQGLRTEARAEFLLHSFQNRIRHSATSIKSAIGIMQEYPNMEPGRRERLAAIIKNESAALGNLIDREAREVLQQPKKEWTLVPVSSDDLVASFRKKAMKTLGIEVGLENDGSAAWVRVDTYSMLLILLFMLERVAKTNSASQFFCGISESERFVHIDIAWDGPAVKLKQLREWESMELHIEREGLPLYCKEVLDYHGAELWPHGRGDPGERACLRLYLPAVKSDTIDAGRHAAVLPDDRPEFYNFDLFNQPGQDPDLDDCLLADLPFTVFDTETTGLNPGGGDKIISIAAVRIVKLHMFGGERFDQLVNPGRDIPAETTKIHGITADMVRSKPGIEEILPMFYQFVSDTILVAHNAAFDMRMLQTYEAQTGIKFSHPVLDTLLLSAVIHPAHDSHNLGDIAKRLGVDVLGRHTAIGDATTTALIFLKMIPLLGKMGIYTLKEAREASQKTYYARLKF